MKRYSFNYGSACYGKVKHRTFHEAEASYKKRRVKLKRNRSGDERVGGLVQVYKCKITVPYEHWHIGKSADGSNKRHAPYKRQRRYNMEDV